MHYKNGREAKNGDKMVLIDGYGASAIGILYAAVPGQDFCNGKLAVIRPNDPTPNLKDCLHLDDVKAALDRPLVDPEAKARLMFAAYNAEGPNPNKTYDGKDVPPWEGLNDQVRGKWIAAAKVS